MHNREQAQYEQDELIDGAQKELIRDALRDNGPSTVSELHQATGVDLFLVRSHCEEMRKKGDINHNWITGKYSR